MEKLMEVLYKSLENIEMEHHKISDHVRQVENDRYSLIAHINALNDASEVGLPILDEIKQNLERLKIKLEKVHDHERIEKNEENINLNTHQSTKKCRYQNRGFCKLKKECEFRHSEFICEEYLQVGKCLKRVWPGRHPKDCQYW